MDIAAIRRGLATNAATVPGLRTHDYAPDSINTPAFFSAEVDISFDGAFGRGLDTVTVTCRVLTSHATDRSGERQLDAYLSGSGGGSLKEALESDETLAGACDDLRVMSIGNYGAYEHNGVPYYGAELTVLVIGSG